MKCLLLLLLLTCAKCMENIYMKHSEVEDQQTSASGYAYQLHTGTPFAGLNNGGVIPYPQLFNQAQDLQLQFPQNQQQQLIPLNHYGQQPQIVPLNHYGQQQLIPLNHYGLQVHPYALHYPLYYSHGTPLSINEASNFAKGGGSSFSDANKNAHGEKGSQGYKTIQQYDKGQVGKHDNAGQKGYYSQQGGKKQSHNDEGAHYGQKQEAAKGSQGSHFNQQSSHKKGSKTSGFHRVHHKDEYKKDHSFYDEKDSSGHFNKHGDFDANHASAGGAFEKGGHEDKAFHADEQGAKGFLDKGHFDGQDSGFKGEAGKQQFFTNFEGFGKKGGQQDEKEFGFDKKDVLYAQQ